MSQQMGSQEVITMISEIPLYTIRMATIKKKQKKNPTDNSKYWQGRGATGILIHCNGTAAEEHSMAVSQKH